MVLNPRPLFTQLGVFVILSLSAHIQCKNSKKDSKKQVQR